MIIQEFQIPLPLEVDEFQVGQLYSVSKASENETTNGEGVEVIQNEPYEDEILGKGQYTFKIYHIGSRLPGWVKFLIPGSALQLHEKAWNAYPYCKTVHTSPFLGERFSHCVETWHKPDCGSDPNAHNLSEEKLKLRTVKFLDIADGDLPPTDEDEKKMQMSGSYTPSTFKSEKTGRGPLKKGWEKIAQPIMCAYKLVTIEIRIFGFQKRLENLFTRIDRDIFLKFHKQVFCQIDEWFGMDMDDIRKIEDESKKKLDEARKAKASKK